MITKPTVLILGAGASQPYGYPSGPTLKDNIIKSQLNDSSVRSYVQLGFSPDEVPNFKRELYRSPLTSVDAFLERRPEFTKIGKIAIAKELIQYEDEDKLLATNDWYQYLFNKMNSSFEDFKDNKLSIITFNYDRSFEHFLMISLMSTFGKSEADCAAIIKQIPVVHVHGKLGDLPWEEGLAPKRDYATSTDINEISQISDEIRIVHEEDPKRDTVFLQAYNLLTLAETIYFLGFGYAQLNVERLRIGDLIHENKEIIGTAYQLADAERDEVTVLSGNKIKLAPPHHTAFSFLKSFGHFR